MKADTIFRYKVARRTAGIVFLLFFFFAGSGQDFTSSPGQILEMSPMTRQSGQENMVSTVLKIKNLLDSEFRGQIDILEAEGLQIIGQSHRSVSVAPRDSLFVPVKFLIRSGLRAGKTLIVAEISDSAGNTIGRRSAEIWQEERTDLSLRLDRQNILIANPADSVHVQATVLNNGNVEQRVTVVFSIPVLKTGRHFVEKESVILPGEAHTFIFGFLPASGLSGERDFQVRITGMRGKDKEIFDNASVAFQVVSSSGRYEGPDRTLDFFNPFQNNTLTLNRRSTNAGGGFTQLIGSGSIDLPYGFLGMSGNLMYLPGSRYPLIGTNTILSYRFDENQIRLGNIYEGLESTVSGRGASYEFGVGDERTIRVGMVDQNYNLFSSLPFFDQGYSLYAIGQIHPEYAQNNFSASLLYQFDEMEQSYHTILGGSIRRLVGNSWDTRLKWHGGYSRPEGPEKDLFSGAAELNYSGRTGDYELSGSYFYSSPYFPGNRRGMAQLQQSVYRRFQNNLSWRANIYYSRYAPKFNVFDFMNTRAQNARGETAVYFSGKRRITTSLGYQIQFESSNNYMIYSESPEDQMSAHRLKESVRWTSRDLRRSLLFTLENGVVRYPEAEQYKFQLRSDLAYSYRGLNMAVTYQDGSYYLSEYFLGYGRGEDFKRFITSVAWNQDFRDKKYQLSAGGNLTNDLYARWSPSGFLNFRFAPKKTYSLYTQSSWMNYRFKDLPDIQTYFVEAGVTLHFDRRPVSRYRKSKLSVLVFYDENSNGIFDPGEAPAKNTTVKINKTLFLTDENGKISYSGLPFGEYVVDRIFEDGWHSSADSVRIDAYQTTVHIPLRKSGTLRGQIQFLYDSRILGSILPEMGGIEFDIIGTDGEVRRRVITDRNGQFLAFVPTGEYEIRLMADKLHPDLLPEETVRRVKITSTGALRLDPFKMVVRQKEIRIKKFSQ